MGNGDSTTFIQTPDFPNLNYSFPKTKNPEPALYPISEMDPIIGGSAES